MMMLDTRVAFIFIMSYVTSLEKKQYRFLRVNNSYRFYYTIQDDKIFHFRFIVYFIQVKDFLKMHLRDKVNSFSFLYKEVSVRNTKIYTIQPLSSTHVESARELRYVHNNI